MNKVALFRAKAVQSIFRSHPQGAVPILENTANAIPARPRRIVGIILKPLEATGYCVKAIQSTAIRSHPQITISVFKQGIHHVGTDTRGVVRIEDKGLLRARLAIKKDKTTGRGRQPETLLAIFAKTIDGILSKRTCRFCLDIQTFEGIPLGMITMGHAIIGSNPERATVIAIDRAQEITAQPLVRGRIMTVMAEPPRFRIIAVEVTLPGPNPKITVRTLTNRQDDIVA